MMIVVFEIEFSQHILYVTPSLRLLVWLGRMVLRFIEYNDERVDYD